MLVIVHDRDVQLFFKPALNLERLGGFNVLQVDPTKRRSDGLHGLHKSVDIRSVDFNVKAVQVCKDLEQDAFAFHHRLAGLWANVPQPEHRSAVGDHRHQVALGGVLVDVLRVFRDVQAGLCHSRRIRQAEVSLRTVWFGGDDFHFTTPSSTVVIQRLFPADAAHVANLLWCEDGPKDIPSPKLEGCRLNQRETLNLRTWPMRPSDSNAYR